MLIWLLHLNQINYKNMFFRNFCIILSLLLLSSISTAQVDMRDELLSSKDKPVFHMKDYVVKVDEIDKKIKNKDEDVILYTHKWGKRTKTPLEGRIEIILNEDFKPIEISMYGNESIAEGCYILSFPANSLTKLLNLPNISDWTYLESEIEQRNKMKYMENLKKSIMKNMDGAFLLPG